MGGEAEPLKHINPQASRYQTTECAYSIRGRYLLPEKLPVPKKLMSECVSPNVHSLPSSNRLMSPIGQKGVSSMSCRIELNCSLRKYHMVFIRDGQSMLQTESFRLGSLQDSSLLEMKLRRGIIKCVEKTHNSLRQSLHCSLCIKPTHSPRCQSPY